MNIVYPEVLTEARRLHQASLAARSGATLCEECEECEPEQGESVRVPSDEPVPSDDEAADVPSDDECGADDVDAAAVDAALERNVLRPLRKLRSAAVLNIVVQAGSR